MWSFVFSLSCTSSPAPSPQQKQSEFLEPESILWDRNQEVYWVSNMNGMTREKDANGFISVVSAEGTLVKPKFISSTREHPLHSPKGMALQGELLLVLDLDTLRVYNSNTGQHIRSELIADSVLLNDIVIAEGDIFISDMYQDKIVRLDGSSFAIKDTMTVQRPNGLLYDQGHLWIASFSKEGMIYRLEISTQNRNEISIPYGYIDGIVKMGEKYLLSSWQYEGLLLGVPGDWAAQKEPKGMFGDISFDEKRERILIPVTKEQRLIFLSQDMESIIHVP